MVEIFLDDVLLISKKLIVNIIICYLHSQENVPRSVIIFRNTDFSEMLRFPHSYPTKSGRYLDLGDASEVHN